MPDPRSTKSSSAWRGTWEQRWSDARRARCLQLRRWALATAALASPADRAAQGRRWPSRRTSGCHRTSPLPCRHRTRPAATRRAPPHAQPQQPPRCTPRQVPPWLTRSSWTRHARLQSLAVRGGRRCVAGAKRLTVLCSCPPVRARSAASASDLREGRPVRPATDSERTRSCRYTSARVGADVSGGTLARPPQPVAVLCSPPQPAAAQLVAAPRVRLATQGLKRARAPSPPAPWRRRPSRTAGRRCRRRTGSSRRAAAAASALARTAPRARR